MTCWAHMSAASSSSSNDPARLARLAAIEELRASLAKTRARLDSIRLETRKLGNELLNAAARAQEEAEAAVAAEEAIARQEPLADPPASAPLDDKQGEMEHLQLELELLAEGQRRPIAVVEETLAQQDATQEQLDGALALLASADRQMDAALGDLARHGASVA